MKRFCWLTSFGVWMLLAAVALAAPPYKALIVDGQNGHDWKSTTPVLKKLLEETKYHFDATDGKSYLCINVVESEYKKDGFHRKRAGLNHVAFRVSSSQLVDTFASEFLEPSGIQSLYGGARLYPEYAEGYYAVYFEDPDRIKVEVVYEPLSNSAAFTDG